MALREILAHFGIEIDKKDAKDADGFVNGLRDKIGAMATALTAGEVYDGFKNMVTGAIEVEGAISDTAAQLGIGRQELQRWGHAATMSGSSQDDFATGIRNLQKNIAAANPELKKLVGGFKNADGSAKSSTQVFEEAGLALAEIPDAAKRNDMAMKLFGKSGLKLLPMFEDGQEGLDKLKNRFEELGIAIDEETLDQLGEAGDALDELELASTSLKAKLAAQLVPAIKKASEWFGKFASWMKVVSKETNILKATMIVLGTIAIATGIKMLLPFLPTLIAVGLLVLVVDDLIGLFEGGDSAIERFMKALLGAEEGGKMVDALRNKWKQFKIEYEQAPGEGGLQKALFVAGEEMDRTINDASEAWRLFWNNLNSDTFGFDGSSDGLFGFLGNALEQAGKNAIVLAGEIGVSITAAILEALFMLIPGSRKIFEGLSDAFSGVDLGERMNFLRNQLNDKLGMSPVVAGGGEVAGGGGPPQTNNDVAITQRNNVSIVLETSGDVVADTILNTVTGGFSGFGKSLVNGFEKVGK